MKLWGKIFGKPFGNTEDKPWIKTFLNYAGHLSESYQQISPHYTKVLRLNKNLK